MLLGEVIEKNARDIPGKEALVFQNQRFSYKEINDKVDRIAIQLTKMGVKKGDVVALLIGNKPEIILCGFASFKIGAMMLPLNFYYKDAELKYIIGNSGASTLIVTDKWQKFNYAERIPNLELDLADPKRIIVIGKPTSSYYFSFSDLLEAPSDEKSYEAFNKNKASVNEDDNAFLVYTGGTTGLPKGVLVSHRGRYSVDKSWTDVLGIKPNDRFLLSMPLFHLLPWHLVVGAFFHGATVILTEVFNAKESLELIEREKVTFLLGVPTVYFYLCAEPDIEKYDLKSLRIGITGGAVFPKERFQDTEKKLGGFRLLNYFGLTEAAGDATTVTLDDPKELAETTVGRAIPGFELRIVDENKKPVPINEEGEIAVKAPWFKGYYKNPEATKETFDSEGWLYTGDTGKLDENGYVTYIGRIKEMFVSGGNNIYPVEIELVIQRHPKVADAIVVPIPDEMQGEIGMAYIVPKPGESLSRDELIAYCKRELASIKIPKEFVFEQKLPLTDVGKVDRKILKKEALEKVRR